MFEVKDCIGFLTNHGAKMISESMNQRFNEQSVTRVQWMALYYIHKKPGMTQKELAADMLIKEPTALHLVDRMESEELISRSVNPNNRRVHCLHLTKKGEKALNVLLPVAEQFNADATEGISEEEMQIFKKVLDKMIQNVQNANRVQKV